MRAEESQRENTPLARARPVRSPANVARVTRGDRGRADEQHDDRVRVRLSRSDQIRVDPQKEILSPAPVM